MGDRAPYYAMDYQQAGKPGGNNNNEKKNTVKNINNKRPAAANDLHVDEDKQQQQQQRDRTPSSVAGAVPEPAVVAAAGTGTDGAGQWDPISGTFKKPRTARPDTTDANANNNKIPSPPPPPPGLTDPYAAAAARPLSTSVPQQPTGSAVPPPSSGGAATAPVSSSSGSWVWRTDLQNPNGEFGVWAWQPASSVPPPPPPGPPPPLPPPQHPQQQQQQQPYVPQQQQQYGGASVGYYQPQYHLQPPQQQQPQPPLPLPTVSGERSSYYPTTNTQQHHQQQQQQPPPPPGPPPPLPPSSQQQQYQQPQYHHMTTAAPTSGGGAYPPQHQPPQQYQQQHGQYSVPPHPGTTVPYTRPSSPPPLGLTATAAAGGTGAGTGGTGTGGNYYQSQYSQYQQQQQQQQQQPSYMPQQQQPSHYLPTGGGTMMPSGGGGGGGGGYQHRQHHNHHQQQPFYNRPGGPPNKEAVALNKKMTGSNHYREILDIVQYNHEKFDTVCLATAVHRLASIRGAPNMHAQITGSPEFHKLKQLVLERKGELQSRNISNIMWGMAKLNHNPGKAFNQPMCDEMTQKAMMSNNMGANAQNIANFLWALSCLNYHPGKECMKTLETALVDKLPEFSSQNISNSILAWCKLEYTPEPYTLDKVAEETYKKLKTFTPQALSNTLWGMSKAGIVKQESLMLSIGREAAMNLHLFNSQNLANTMWAFGNMGINPGADLLDKFARESVHKMAEFTPQNISNICWAYAKLGVAAPELFRAADAHACATLHAFVPQAVSNLLWAHASLLEKPEPSFFHKCVSFASGIVSDFSAQNLSNVSWALAVILRQFNVPDYPALTVQLAKQLVADIARESYIRLTDPEKAATFSRQHLANIVYSWAVIDLNVGTQTLQVVADALSLRADECNPQEISNSIFAFTTLKFYHRDLFNAMATETRNRIDEFNALNLIQLVHSLAQSDHYDEALLILTADHVVAAAEDLSMAHLQNVISSFARFRFSTPNFMPRMRSEVLRRVRDKDAEMTSYRMVKFCWDFAVSEALNKKLWDAMVDLVEKEKDYGGGYSKLNETSRSMIFQCYLLAEATNKNKNKNKNENEGGGGGGGGRGGDAGSSSGWWKLPPALHSCCEQVWKTNVKEITVSTFHSEVSHILSSMGVDHAIEHLTEDGLFSSDIALPQEHIAVEVDGPHHFTVNTFRPLANMFMRRALLEARGWRVASVAFYQWAGLDTEGKKELMAHIIKKVRSQRPGEAHPTTAAAEDVRSRPVDRGVVMGRSGATTASGGGGGGISSDNNAHRHPITSHQLIPGSKDGGGQGQGGDPTRRRSATAEAVAKAINQAEKERDDLLNEEASRAASEFLKILDADIIMREQEEKEGGGGDEEMTVDEHGGGGGGEGKKKYVTRKGGGGGRGRATLTGGKGDAPRTV